MSQNKGKIESGLNEPTSALLHYMNAIEDRLQSDFKSTKSFSHSLNQGSVREHFIREFLTRHFSEKFAFGTGEIIHANSKRGEARNQFDIVMYDKSYPKLTIGGITAFLAESVVATIEIKSTLSEKELKKAIMAARKVKDIEPNFICSWSCGHVPPKIVNYVLAYDCTALSIDTVFKWVQHIYKDEQLTDQFDVSNLLCKKNNSCQNNDSCITKNCFTAIPSQSLDGIFILSQGSIVFGNVPIHLIDDVKVVQDDFHLDWLVSAHKNGSLSLLFQLLVTAISNIQGRFLNPNPYFQEFTPELEHKKL